MRKVQNQLRKWTEASLGATGEKISALSPEDSRELIHELHTHQIKMEMRNEALRQSEQELTQARDQFSDLYDVAPACYATISAKGIIEQAMMFDR